MSGSPQAKASLETRPREGGPEWLATRRARLAEALERDGFPTRKTEAWRFTPAAPFLEDATEEAPGASEAAARTRAESLPALGTARAILVDGRPLELPRAAGVVARPLREALEGASLELRSFESKEPFARLNALRFDEGLHLTVGPDAAPGAVLEIVHASTGGATRVRYPRVVVTVERGASCTIFERSIGSEDQSGATHSVVDVRLEEGARLDHVHLGEDPGLSTRLVAARVGRGAFYGSYVAALAGRVGRANFEVSLEGEGAEAELFGVYLAGDRDHLDHHLRVEHRVPHCSSRMKYHGVIDGRATAVFDGITVVHQGAQGTVAHQENRNLLVSEHATVHTKPHLEIDADDVKCSHGSTVGALDEQSLFYMRARGIPEELARAMLTEAFVQAPVDAFPETVRELVRERLRGAPEEER